MSTVTVSGIYQNGSTVFPLPPGFDPANIWLLVNGQVWTSSSLILGDGSVTAPNVDFSEELVQISDQTVVDTSNLSLTLEDINTKLDSALSEQTINPPLQIENTINRITEVRTRLNPYQQFRQVKGMCATTGKTLTGIDHLRQSLRDIILTRTRQRVMLREYGLDDGYLDKPGNRYYVMRLYSRLAEAIRRWEPRLELTRLSVSVGTAGQFDYRFEGNYLGSTVQFGVVV